MTIEELVIIHGEKYRQLIVDALGWLQLAETSWNLDKPIDPDDFISDLVGRAS